MTHSSPDLIITGKTYKTDVSISNQEFLETIFGKVSSDTRPLIVSYAGNPQKVDRSAWSGKSWYSGMLLPMDHNAYFSISVYNPDKSGGYRRRKKQFAALYAMMLDDVGTKVDRERLTLPPSYLLETSRGNFQAGYLLASPITDAGTADRLMNAFIACGLSDPGADGPTARLARLPKGINGKHTPPFQCTLTEWYPERRYTVEDLVDGLQLDMHQSGRQKANTKSIRRSAGNDKSDKPDGNDEIFLASPTENPVIAALRNRKLYKCPLGQGKHDISCPWLSEHTDQVDGGTAYFEPDDSFPIGGFKCLHGHCANRHIRNLLEFLCVEPNAARMKSTIRCVAGEIHRISDKAEQELAKTSRHYQRGGLIVTVSTDPSIKETSVRDLSQPALVTALSCAAMFERYDARSHDWVRTDPPSRIVSVLYDATDYRHLPVLNGLTHQPYLRPDGTLTRTSGYDRESGMFGVFNALKFNVPDQPTKDDAIKALAVISDLLSEFSFPKSSDKSAALTAILTAAIRPSLAVAPMYHIRAPQISSGKSFLCQLVTAFVTPKRGAPTTFPQDDEECRKVLLAELLRAPAVIEFDNLTSDLIAHKSLCTALTSEYMTGRILGISKTATVSTRALFLSSGNNVSPVQDMVRRCLTINLDPACEIPASRTFERPNLLTDVLKERENYVSAALTIIRAWIVAGRPQTACKALASYSEWSDLCRQPLLWLGLPDPTEALFEAMKDDPDRDTLGRLLAAWHAKFGKQATMIRQAADFITMNISTETEEIREAMNDIAGDRNGLLNRRILGRWIKRHAGRIVDGRRFTRASGSRSAEAWIVESVS